jgi:hypothetical protein
MKTEKVRDRRHDTLSLAGRIVHFYRFFNRRDWGRCFDYIDPKLRDDGKVDPADYAETMDRFFAAHGPIRQIRIVNTTIYPGASSRSDGRDFAYMAVSWKDRANGLHHFRERWIKDQGRWYTRVLGLVPRPSSP